jgi:hypothetical protein
MIGLIVIRISKSRFYLEGLVELKRVARRGLKDVKCLAK